MYTTKKDDSEIKWVSLDRLEVVETPKQMLEQLTFLMAVQVDGMVGRAASHQEIVENMNRISELARVARQAASLADELVKSYHIMSECYTGYFSPEECGEEPEDQNGTEAQPWEPWKDERAPGEDRISQL